MSSRPLVLLVLGLATTAGGCGREGEAFRPVFAGTPCSHEAAAALSRWGPPLHMVDRVASAGPAVRVRVPIGGVGEWIVIDIQTPAGPVLTRFTRDGFERLTFDRDCSPLRTLLPAAALAGGASDQAFTDADLLRLTGVPCGAGPPRVVYVWSPHMPLSVDGYGEISRAARAIGASVTPVLLAGSDRDFARREAERVGLAGDGLREVASVELILRDAEVHAPTVIVFDGPRVSEALPGYRTAAGYRAFIDDFLARGCGQQGSVR